MQLTVGTVWDGPHKIDLPESVLDPLSAWMQHGPLVFQVGATHVGVREFSAPEGQVALGRTVAADLGVSPGDTVDLEPITLPKGLSVTLKVTEDIDWKAVLEARLPASYTALSKGDTIRVDYLGKTYTAAVTELQPADAVCIVDTDLDLIIENAQTTGSMEPRTVFRLGKPLKLGAPIPLQLDKSIQSYDFAVEGVAYVGPQYATSDNSYLWKLTGARTIETGSLPDTPLSVTGRGVVTITASASSKSSEEEPPTVVLKQCGNCKRMISPQAFVVHESFCLRNNIRCDVCGEVFPRQVASDHWHCSVCGRSGIDGHTEHMKDHEPTKCGCGYEGDFNAVALHRAGDCPERLVECRFCKLVVPQETATSVDKVRGLTGHEAYCGSKTTLCNICNKPVRGSDLAVHLEGHDVARRSRPTPIMCSNKVCPGIVSTRNNTRGLCKICYGSVYSGQHDPDGTRLRATIERKYIIQMTRGCGNSWCNNQYCASGSGSAKKASEAMPLVKELLSHGAYYFCVSQLMAKRAMFLYEDGMYAREWRGMAINNCSNETEAEKWLQLHAPKLNEGV